MSAIVFNQPKEGSLSKETSESILQSEVENLQTTLASLNQQVITLQEALGERDQEIADLKTRLAEDNSIITSSRITSGEAKTEDRADETLTIVGAFINLYKFAFPPGKEVSAPTY